MPPNTRRPVTRLGLQIPRFTFPGIADAELFEHLVSIAAAAEESGFDSLWVMDHLYQIPTAGDRTEPMLESYTTLAALGARTRTVRLGTMVTGVTYRNPALLAKIVTTLDVLTSGRAILGIGAAWNDDEHRGYGFEFPPVRERMERLQEALEIAKAMFTQQAPSFEGRYYRIDAVLNNPRPVTPGGPPILVGGTGEQRTLRLVARYADACNLFGDAPTIRHKLEVLAERCAEVGRDPAEITKTRLGTLVLRKTSEEAAEVAEGMRAVRGLDEEQFRASVLVGGPDEVAEQVQPYLDAGLDGMIFNLAEVTPEAVALAGEVLGGVLPPA
ncbi:MAG TPA: LLM class F420-dependent oxidoreductase [Actinomycetota bacterium]|jgi:F420-dependent oxidoreductase-like protein